MSCDIITNVNLFEFIESHQRSKASISMLLKSEDLERGKKQGNPPVSCNLSDTYDICLIDP